MKKIILLLLTSIQIITYAQLQDFDSGVFPPTTPNVITNPIWSGGTSSGNPATWYRSDDVVVNGTFGNDGLNNGFGGTGNCVILYSNRLDGYNPFFEVDMIINNVDMSSYSSPMLKFYIKHPDGGEEIEIAASDSGGTYSVLQTFSSNYSNWTLVSVDLSSYGNSTDVSIRFRGKESSPFSADMINVGIDNIEIIEQTNMAYLSSTTSHVNCGLKQGYNNQAIMKIEVVTQGTLNPIDLTKLVMNTSGSSDDCNDVRLKKIYYTGTSNSFSTINLIGSTELTGTYTINSKINLSEGTNYFWLACDISDSATLSDTVDAECVNIVVNGNTETPTITAPIGSLAINNTGIFVVSNLNNTGAGSFRDAINSASAYNCGDAIVDASGVSGIINWNSQINLNTNHNISIIGSGPNNLTIRGTPGGFMYHYGEGSIQIEGFHFTKFSSGVVGQAIIYKPNSAGDIHIKNCNVDSNTVRFLYIPNSSGDLIIENSTFSNNTNSIQSGVMYIANMGGSIKLSNSTFYNNYSAEYAGVMYVANVSGGLFIENCTFMNNSCLQSFGGAIRAANASPVVLNTTFENNTPNEFFGSLSMNYSHMSNTSSANISGANNILNVSGGLSALGNNGGKTPTCSINTGSILINAGTTNLIYDQRGYGRPNMSDIGAYEFNGAQDVTAPVPDSATLSDVNYCFSVFALTAPTATDDFASTVNVSNDACLPITTPGTTVVTWTFDDGNGNTITKTQNIINTTINTSTTLTGSNISSNAIDASYQWLDCNNNYAVISEETKATYTPSANGSYAVKLTKNGCIDTSSCVTISNLGIIENSFGKNLILYPNPTNGSLSVDLGEFMGSIKINITDISGRLIQTSEFINTQTINLSITEPSGIYILTIESAGHKAIFQILKN
ncbi:MAG: BNR-repeat neuraminidase N-terminal domain-containing protein [Bacteroidota bacterium]|nr:BNR-repeat neuraminidase N-terminal domain-containing protein [Bacteroidota bacterium]